LIRWYAGKALSDYLLRQTEHSIGTFKFSFRKVAETWISIIHEAKQLAGSEFKDDSIPSNLPGVGELNIGIWFKTNLDKSTIGHPNKLGDIRNILADTAEAKLLSTDGSSTVDGFGRLISGVLIVDKEGEFYLFIVFPDEDVFSSARVQTADEPVHLRSPEWDVFNCKTIGIVGLGSVGSKIAMSLARMGCRKFYLIDHDLFLPENLQRHSLDWQAVVQHKVDAMKIAISLLAPGYQIEVSRLHITWQESNAALSGALNRLTSCDIIIDATANARVFNLLAAVTRTTCLPMIWMEVFGGGMGGLVARCRPRIDPTPQDMRGAYQQFCTVNPAPDTGSILGNYAIETEEGEVLVASDADVAIIAHHAVRFVLDCFTPPERSIFPYSMYLIGLTKNWIFEAPFDTIPISTESYSVKGWEKDNAQELEAEDIQFLCDLFKKDDNATSNTT